MTQEQIKQEAQRIVDEINNQPMPQGRINIGKEFALNKVQSNIDLLIYIRDKFKDVSYKFTERQHDKIITYDLFEKELNNLKQIKEQIELL